MISKGKKRTGEEVCGIWSGHPFSVGSEEDRYGLVTIDCPAREQDYFYSLTEFHPRGRNAYSVTVSVSVLVQP